jgi:DNA mismatch repair ATPase MutS
VFDELYSGTNPEEAILSAYVVMDYLANHPTVSTILTTHYVKLCKKLSKNPRITNCHMKVLEDKEDSNKFEYLYSLEEGISEIKGGIKVLIDMNYPQEIIDKTGK